MSCQARPVLFGAFCAGVAGDAGAPGPAAMRAAATARRSFRAERVTMACIVPRAALPVTGRTCELYGDAAPAPRHSPVPPTEGRRPGQPPPRGRGARTGGRARAAPARGAVSRNGALGILRTGRRSRAGAHVRGTG